MCVPSSAGSASPAHGDAVQAEALEQHAEALRRRHLAVGAVPDALGLLPAPEERAGEVLERDLGARTAATPGGAARRWSAWCARSPGSRGAGRARTAPACRRGRRGRPRRRTGSWQRLSLGVAFVEPVPESHRGLAVLPAEIHRLVSRSSRDEPGEVHQTGLDILHRPAERLHVLEQAAHLDGEPVEPLRARLPLALGPRRCRPPCGCARARRAASPRSPGPGDGAPSPGPSARTAWG